MSHADKNNNPVCPLFFRNYTRSSTKIGCANSCRANPCNNISRLKAPYAFPIPGWFVFLFAYTKLSAIFTFQSIRLQKVVTRVQSTVPVSKTFLCFYVLLSSKTHVPRASCTWHLRS